MGMVVRTNTMALNAYRQLGMNNSAVAKSLEKLASGYRINRAGDDAAGLAISEKMKAQITGLETASANAQDGISLIQTAEGNLGEVHDMLNRMVELATKSANGTYTQQERSALQDEVNQLLSEIDRISKSANFNGAKLLDGSLAANNAILSKNVKLNPAQNDEVWDGKSLGVSATGSDHINAAGLKDRQNPEFAINLADVKFNLPANASGGALTYTIALSSIGGQSISLYSAATTGTGAFTAATVAVTHGTTDGTAASTLTAADIAGKFDGLKAVIGNDVYTISKEGDTKLKFTYAGQKNGNDLVAATADGGAPKDTSIVPKGNVSLAIEGTGTSKDNRYDCHVVDIKDPQAASDAVRSGAKLTLDMKMIQSGSLKIGDTTFNFSSTAEVTVPPAQTTGTVTIGYKGLTNEDEILKSVTEQMSHCHMTWKAGDKQDGDAYTFNIGRGTDNKTIEIEEQPLAGKGYGKFTEAQLQKAFTQTRAAANASAEVTMTKDEAGNFVNFSAGNTLKIGNTTYTFSEGNNNGNNVKIGADAAATLNNLAGKLNGYTLSVDAAAGKFTVTANTKDMTKPEFGDFVYTAKTVDDGGLTLQIGDTAEEFNKMTVAVENMSAEGLAIDGLDITTEKLASDAIDKIKTAINSVSTARAGMGALQNRLEHTINNLDVAAENLSAANSRIRDTDMAKEMMNYTKMNVLVQSAQAMLAQANQQPQSVLQLLQ